ncbi:SH3b domain-containing protein [Candidatus Liberibacter solanacearum]|uniref:SH3 domain-containing protein n=1 Tax=Candidatus Liberibacter solanacearum TaxID=556287 RepID=UPI003871D3E0
MSRISHIFFISTLAIYFYVVQAPIFSQEIEISKKQLIPRFVTIKSNRANTRIGPGKIYTVVCTYLIRGLPVEIIQEYENWRQIRDVDGTTGWINKILLSNKRSAIVSPWNRKEKNRPYIDLHQKPETQSIVVAKVEPGVLLTIRECSGEWCFGYNSDVEGWIKQKKIWGIYPGEVFK